MKSMRAAVIAITTALGSSGYAGAAAADSSAVVPPARNYKVHELTLAGASCRARAIQAGTAVGWCNTPDGSHAFVWTESTGVVDIGTLGGSRAEASALDGERVVGFSTTSGDAESHAFSWTRSGGMEDLGALGGGISTANSVSGERIVGDSLTADGDFHAHLWTPAAGITDLGTLASGTESSAAAIDGRLIAGWSATNGALGRRPVAWRVNGQLIDLVGEPIEVDGRVRGEGISTDVDDGLVVGFRRNEALESRAFAWHRRTGLVDLGVVPGSNESFAFATDAGLVVGQLSGVGGPIGFTNRAFVWSSARGMRAITPITIVARATHVNAGRVLGDFVAPGVNGIRTFLWTPARGLVDVTPDGFPEGAGPAGIDSEGRIAVAIDSEDPRAARSAILVPRRLPHGGH